MEATLQTHLPGSAHALLEGWRADQDKLRRREAKALTKVIAWLTTQLGTGPIDHDHLHDIPLGGHGCPELPETVVAEFACVASMNLTTARSYLADAWDLQWRLPELRARVQAGEVELWRARQAAAALRHLPFEGAAYIDQRLAPIAAKVGPARLRQLVILGEFLSDPDAAVARARSAAEARGVALSPSPGAGAEGLMDLFGRLDYADASDLEAAIGMVAAELDPDQSLDVRRSQALGVMARRQLSGSAGGFVPDAEVVETRIVHIYVHLRPDTPVGELENGGWVSVARVKEWCRTAGTKVILRPVLDLADQHSRDGYVPTELMREQAVLVNRTCVHPHCTTPARSADLDHIVPFDPGGPPGQTVSENLAPLCRTHHRLKTHAGWSYTRLDPGFYLWRSPKGRSYLRTPTGTINLEERNVLQVS